MMLPIAKGILTYLPFAYDARSGGTAGTTSARYCYAVWMRHLILAYESGWDGSPETVAELGPGDSLGIGLAALLSGARQYYALDVVEFATLTRNIEILDGLLDLYAQRVPIPGPAEFTHLKPSLEEYGFPSNLLPPEKLVELMDPARISAIRRTLEQPGQAQASGISIAYYAPWFESSLIRPGSVDLAYAQAVMEHVDDLPFTYQTLSSWLRPGGLLSLQVDFKSHGTAGEWNGHWTYPDWQWRLIRGKRPYLINRQPCSAHLQALERSGFEVLRCTRFSSENRLARSRLASRFKNLSEADLCTSGAFIQAVKRGEADK